MNVLGKEAIQNPDTKAAVSAVAPGRSQAKHRELSSGDLELRRLLKTGAGNSKAGPDRSLQKAPIMTLQRKLGEFP